MLVPQVCVYGAWNWSLGLFWMWMPVWGGRKTGMSTRLWTIQYRTLTRAFTRHSSRGSQPIRSSIAEKHYWYSHSLPGLSPSCFGPIPHLIIQGWVIYLSQLVLGASYGGGKHRLWLSLLLGEHVIAAWWTCERHNVSLWRDMPVYLAMGASVWLSRVVGIHWRLIAGHTQQLALLWMEGHTPL